jgi:uroporphyrinogen decarboxylase
LDRFDRVFAALAGEAVDRVPIALWRHCPGSDATAGDLFNASIRWQRQYDWDFLKITPAAGYPYEPWGARFVYPGVDPVRVDRGIRECIEESRPVQATSDWQRIQRINVHEDPFLAQLIAGTARIADEVGSTVPTLQTVFSPGYTVMQLAGPDRFLTDLRANPGKLRSSFDAVTETTIDLSLAFLDAGATGLFFSTYLAASQFLTPSEYRDVCMPYDLQVLEAVRSRTKLLVHHIHGDSIYFDMLADYPVDAVNWEDQTTPPTLAKGRATSGACVIGGISEAVLHRGTPTEIRSRVRATVSETAGRRLIVGTGCVTPVTTPDANIAAARAAIEETAVPTQLDVR